ncbi:MAG: OsmC family protein [Proteobacteria bacterium]|nr:OsmC family protein [Pseudomonadota bacterium]
MPTYTAEAVWTRGEQPFVDKRYSRRHVVRFDGGAELPASSSPHSVPPPYSDLSAVDPEEALVGAVASCHLLWFLSLAARDGFRVDRYEDAAVGTMAPNPHGKLAIDVVTLHPRVTFGEHRPTRAQFVALHAEAHHECAIAHSLRGEVRCEPEIVETGGGR